MKIKILFVASEYSSGMIPFAGTIIKMLNEDEHFEVYALVVNSGNNTYKRVLKGLDKTHLFQIEYPKNKIKKLIYKFYPVSIIQALKEMGRRIKPDIIHLLTGDFGFAPYLLLHKPSNKFYYTVHDLNPHKLKSNSLTAKLLRRYIDWGYRLLRNRINNLTTSSQMQYEELKNIYPNKHISFTHFPTLVTKEIQEGDKQVPELKNEKDYILFWGAVNVYKGVDLLIMAYLNSEKLKYRKLVIAGIGLDYSDLIKEDKNIIRINRFLDDAEIKDLFGKAMFVVYPYRAATMSGVLSVAYYFKKRVLLSNVPFFIDNKTVASTFFECGDTKSLQTQMELLVTGKEVKEGLGECYEEIYSSRTLVEDYCKLYLAQ